MLLGKFYECHRDFIYENSEIMESTQHNSLTRLQLHKVLNSEAFRILHYRFLVGGQHRVNCDDQVIKKSDNKIISAYLHKFHQLNQVDITTKVERLTSPLLRDAGVLNRIHPNLNSRTNLPASFSDMNLVKQMASPILVKNFPASLGSMSTN